MAQQLRFIFLHGKPAVGKDAQATLLKHSFPDSRKISGIFRSAIKGEGEFAKFKDEINPYTLPLGKGIKVPGELVVRMLDDAVERGTKEGIDTFIFCGVLRSREHLDAVDEWIKGLSQTRDIKTDHIYYEASDEVSLKRANYRFLKMQLEGTTRPDDTTELVSQRIRRFNENVQPLLDELSSQERLKRIDASSASEVIYEETQRVLGLAHKIASPEGNLKTEMI